MAPFDNVKPSEARMNYLEPQQDETAQADFEQQLRESQPILAASGAPGAGSNQTVTDGNKRARAIPENERCAVASFVRTRAQLAATLTCANIAELRREIELAGQRSAQWSRATGPSAVRIDSGRIYDDVMASSYAELQRLQNHASDCKPHGLDGQSAMAHLRSMAALRYREAPWNIWGGQRLDLGRAAAEHMRGDTSSSPFVSLSEEASQLPFRRTMTTSMVPKSSRRTRMSCTPTRCRGLQLGRRKRSSVFLRTGLRMMNPIWHG
ncbi:hypothetical protein FBZ94_11086 [Bradyrhizobium sacchari]|uniref:Uncharacterized protein n=1 Tax=Bradyrhizobium sacchari TaxID=1399419 RepID=A0A560JMF7_9BRAD|nr:hypothetical protein FBZ94_11086 [Bradyrhizobium sacchari]TWB69490.1 hypothetical protein FBZ95_10986 [Bradyrhizobium sacchari]